jgi:hypothetical protein
MIATSTEINGIKLEKYRVDCERRELELDRENENDKATERE